MSQEGIFLKADRVVITALLPEDAPALARYRHLPEVARYQSWQSYSEEEARKLIAAMQRAEPFILDSWYQFGLRLLGQPRLIGDIGIRRRLNGPSYDAEIGYSLDPTFQRQGLMREALGVFIPWIRRQLFVRRISASLDPRNEPSARLLIALGFQREARYRQSVWFKGAWADDDVYVLHEDDSERQRSEDKVRNKAKGTSAIR